jgi:hypothetical protein
MAKQRVLQLLAGLAAACTASAALAQPQQVTSVDVPARAPTSISLVVSGKDVATVRREIRIAAFTVCDNAITNNELSFVDRTWCSDGAIFKANRKYQALSRDHLLASSDRIVLSAR